MPTVKCPVVGFEHVTITYPDEWLMRHIDKYGLAIRDAPEASAISTLETYKAIGLCDNIEGLELNGNISNLPIKYFRFFKWLRETVAGSFDEAMAPDPN
jgi:hypothetical protein